VPRTRRKAQKGKKGGRAGPRRKPLSEGGVWVPTAVKNIKEDPLQRRTPKRKTSVQRNKVLWVEAKPDRVYGSASRERNKKVSA